MGASAAPPTGDLTPQCTLINFLYLKKKKEKILINKKKNEKREDEPFEMISLLES